MMSTYTHTGVVYFAVRGRYVKIGYSAAPDPKVRLTHIGAGRGLVTPHDFEPGTASLLHTIPGCVVRDEVRIHSLFAQHHAAGEWFHLTPHFLNHLAELRYVTYAESVRNFRRARAALRRSPSLVLRSAA